MSSLAGMDFGPLRIVTLWGYQSSNAAWVYYCRACGHIGKRLGTHMVRRVRTTCPKCNAADRSGRSACPRPSAGVIAAWLTIHGPNSEAELARQAVPGSRRVTRAPSAQTTTLEGWDTESLIQLQGRIESILRRKRGLDPGSTC